MTRHLHMHSRGVVHHLPHRTRLRIPTTHRDPATVRRIRDAVSSVPNVHVVETNDRTGSILVHHAEHSEILPAIGKAIESVAVDLFETMLELEEFESPAMSVLGYAIRSNISKVNTTMSGYTGNSLDLKMLLPIAFFGLGVLQASRNERWWMQTPTYVLFYWAYDSFMKFHGPNAQTAKEIAGNGGGGRLSKGYNN